MSIAHRLFGIAIVIVALLPTSVWAGATVYSFSQNGGLVGFNTAAGNPPIAIDFDSVAANTNIASTTIAGVTFNSPVGGAPLLVVNGNSTFTPAGFSGAPNPAANKLFPTSGSNVLSPGGLELGPGPNNSLENDDLELVLQSPLAAIGFDHLSQSADGASYTNVTVFNQANAVLFSGTIPISGSGVGGDSGGANFWGITTDAGDLVARIVIDEQDGDSQFPDCNIGFDSIRFTSVPEPSSLMLACVLTFLLFAVKRPFDERVWRLRYRWLRCGS